MTKKMITVWVGTPKIAEYSYGTREQYIVIPKEVSIYIRGPLTTIIKNLQAINSKYGKEYSDLHIDSYNDYADSEYESYALKGSRLETDLEYEFRISQEKKAQKNKEVREREEFERLKKKFKE